MAASELLEITPRGPLRACVSVPGSKSISNRALLIAALARGESRLHGLLDSDDTQVMAAALRALGAAVRNGTEQRDEPWRVGGVAGAPRAPAGVLDIGANGTAARFLTALLALVPGESVLDGSARMRERPIGELVEALRALGVEVTAEGRGGCPPVRCRGGAPFGGETEIDASRSSQYVSALLLIAPYAARGMTLRLRDGLLASRPYVDVTLQMMRAFGADAGFRDETTLTVAPGRTYAARDYAVEPDASTAAYFFAAAAIGGGSVRVQGLRADSLQADMAFLALLERMGCDVVRDDGGIEVRGPSGPLRAFDADMNAMPDAVLAAAVTALFADGTTRIRNVGHLRIKESDRLLALETELRKLGADARADADALVITPRALHGAEIATYDDHRMAMAFALAGLRLPGVRIRDPNCVAKSWPGYFEVFSALR
jgi:3-phosphoshikimate 1-carboxyvinyltransferase